MKSKVKKARVTKAVVILPFFMFGTAFAGETPHHTSRITPSVRWRSGLFVSPDGLYVVRYMAGDASGGDRFALCRQTNTASYHSLVSIRSLYKIRGFAWVPTYPHRLVLAVKREAGASHRSQNSEKPFLAVWDGGPRLHYLLFGKLKANEDPDAEDIELAGVSRDGKTIVYEHDYYDDHPQDLSYDPSKHPVKMDLPLTFR